MEINFKTTYLQNQTAIRAKSLIDWSSPVVDQLTKFSTRKAVCFFRFVPLKIWNVTSIYLHLKSQTMMPSDRYSCPTVESLLSVPKNSTTVCFLRRFFPCSSDRWSTRWHSFRHMPPTAPPKSHSFHPVLVTCCHLPQVEAEEAPRCNKIINSKNYLALKRSPQN